MKYTIILLFLPLFCVAQDWVKTTSRTGAFTVVAPAVLDENTRSVSTKIGELNYHTFAYRDTDEKAENWLYVISYVDYPKGSLHADSTELVQDFLAETIASSLESAKGTLVYASDIKYKGAVGKIWRIDFGTGKGSGVFRTKAFVKGNRFYTIQTACPKENSLNTSSDRFFKSFDFLEKID